MESSTKAARRMHGDLADALARACERAGIPFDHTLRQGPAHRLYTKLRRKERELNSPMTGRHEGLRLHLERLCEITGHPFDPTVTVREAKDLVNTLNASRRARWTG